MKVSQKIPVRFLATTPSGDMAVDERNRETYLPVDPQGPTTDARLRYGPYLEAVQDFIFRKDGGEMLAALGSRLGRQVDITSIDWIDIRTEKHGACYQVARVDVRALGKTLSFAVNVAVTESGKSQLRQDFRLLRRLGGRYGYHLLPRVYFKGAERYRERGGRAHWLHMFVAQWFEGYHEFHLSRKCANEPPCIFLWDLDGGSRYLSRDRSLELYRQAAEILTLYYDWNGCKQIYPWHHAAGDFVLREDGGKVDVRLITIRDYSAVVDFRTEKREAKLLALILFFLHLTIQMRLDRLDGVGGVAWAEDYCLEGVVTGFFEGWVSGDHRSRRTIPAGGELMEVLRSFDGGEWFHLLEECLGAYQFSREELSLVQEYGRAHLDKLQQVLAGYG